MHRILLLLALAVPHAHAQFTVLAINSTAGLRGIAAADAKGQVAWASGTGGTVLRTVDGGTHWTPCATPPAAEKLDFRAIQAFDAQNALVMSSGSGQLSRVYRTSDGCRTWKLVFTNPDAPGGFFDAMVFPRRDQGWLLGDPVNGRFYLALTQDGGETWTRINSPSLTASDKGGAFAASNQSLLLSAEGPTFGGSGALLYRGRWAACSLSLEYNDPEACYSRAYFQQEQLPLAATGSGAGIFALARNLHVTVAVGGDYTAPANPAGTAAYSTDGGETWSTPDTPPRGYRSSVAYDANSRTWIAVGPNGTDASTDNGRTWKPLLPDAAKGDAADADQRWNALALPWVVGPKGRIGRLRADALAHGSLSH